MWSLICHGGAGPISADVEDAHRAGCRRATEVGRDILARGGSAVDAVVASVRVLEDDPSFNAGIGSTVDDTGMVTCDASIMSSEELALGAVGAVAGVRHPIDLARAIMDDGKHAFLVGAGALDFARARGLERIDPARMERDPSRSQWWHAEADRSLRAPADPGTGDTVGAVALDAAGRLATATSTGGLLGKYAGRVGDSPIAGAGCYARSDLGALSATGHGETLMRTVFAYQALLSLASIDPDSVDGAEILRRELDRATSRIGGRGGAIAVLPGGQTVWARNTPHMGVAWTSDQSPIQTAF